LNVEHNFRTLPFLWLDIPFLYENNIEFVVHGGVVLYDEMSHGSRYAIPGSDVLGVDNTTPGSWYYEIGFGISRIFELLRCDFTWRLSDPQIFHFTLAVANLL
jgi:hypothetical protein